MIVPFKRLTLSFFDSESYLIVNQEILDQINFIYEFVKSRAKLKISSPSKQKPLIWKYLCTVYQNRAN